MGGRLLCPSSGATRGWRGRERKRKRARYARRPVEIEYLDARSLQGLSALSLN